MSRAERIEAAARAIVSIQNYIDEVHRRGHGFDGLRESEGDRARAIQSLRDALAQPKPRDFDADPLTPGECDRLVKTLAQPDDEPDVEAEFTEDPTGRGGASEGSRAPSTPPRDEPPTSEPPLDTSDHRGTSDSASTSKVGQSEREAEGSGE